MTLYDYLRINSISYDDFAYVVKCSRGYIIDIVHGRSCSLELGEKIYSITDNQVIVRTTKGEVKC